MMTAAESRELCDANVAAILIEAERDLDRWTVETRHAMDACRKRRADMLWRQWIEAGRV